MTKRSKAEREERKLHRLREILDSDSLKRYIEEGDKIKPLVLKILGNEIGRFITFHIADLLLRIRFNSVYDYRDSMMPAGQLGAPYAALEILKSGKNSKILYFACSYGLGMRMMAEAGYGNIEGIDLDKKAVDFCNSQGLKARVADATKTGLDSESFDLVITRDFVVPEYGSPENRISILNEQYRVLRPGGFTVFTTMIPVERGADYHGMPAEQDIRNSFFNSSYESELFLDLRGIDENFPEVTLPVRYFRK